MIEQIQNEVNEFCSRFEHDTDIKVSAQTRELAALVLSSIMEDPHPAWEAGDGRLESITKAYVSALPMMLYQIVNTEKVQGRITAFDFLHWFPKFLEDKMCIIPK